MNDKKVIFIDLDGTILNVYDRVYQLYKDILKKYNKKFLYKKRYIALKRKKIKIEKILEMTNSSDIISKFKKEWKKNIESYNYLELDKIHLSNRKTLIALKNMYRLVLITLRNHPKRLFWELKNKKIDNIFEEVIVVPNKYCLNKWELKFRAIKKYKNFSKECIIVGDTETDILAGKNLGIKTIAVGEGMRDSSLLKKYKPDFLIKNIADFKKIYKMLG